MEAASKVIATATAGAVSLAAANADKLPAPIVTALASLITAAGAALIRWIERKVLRVKRDKLTAENAQLRIEIESLKRLS